MKTGILIVNYNMPERTDALVEHINNFIRCDHETIVIDNGSDLVPPSRYTTLPLPKNVQTTGGWLAGLEIARKAGCEAYWFLITSTELTGGDVLSPMVELLEQDANAVGVHPALNTDCNTAWKHLCSRGGNQPRRTWMLDNIASLYRADWFDQAGGFDPQLKYAWGIDLETSWKARSQGRSLWVHEGCRVKKVTDIGYTMRRMGMSADERAQRAGANMAEVLSKRYGPSWWDRMKKEYVTDDLL